MARRAFAGVAGGLAYWLAYDGEKLVGSSMLRVLPGLGYLQGRPWCRRLVGEGSTRR